MRSSLATSTLLYSFLVVKPDPNTSMIPDHYLQAQTDLTPKQTNVIILAPAPLLYRAVFGWLAFNDRINHLC